MRFLLRSAFVVAVIVALFTPADAVVFLTDGKWPAAADGLVRVKVCVHADTKVDQKRKSTLVHDRNPTRDEVIARIRAALAGSWERVSAVRFEGWQPCGPSEPTSTVVLKLHPDVNARAKLGYSAVTAGSLYPDANIDIEFKPWGTHGGAREACLGYDVGSARVKYRWTCVEQYAIHEFGHILGFAHEWQHPKVSEECRKADVTSGEPIAAASGSAWPTTQPWYVPYPEAYDRDSIMVYDTRCADVTGRRFGSENLSAKDQAAAATVYPEPAACVLGYEHAGYGGAVYPLGCGKDPPHRSWNDRISSVRVPAGVSVKFCEHTRSGKCGGKTRSIVGPSDLDWIGKDWNDKISWYDVTATSPSALVRLSAPGGASAECPSVSGPWAATVSLDGGKTAIFTLEGNLCDFTILEGSTPIGSGTADASGAILSVPFERDVATCVGSYQASTSTFSTRCQPAAGADGFTLTLRRGAAAPSAPVPGAWTCLPGITTPVRNEGGHVQCASRNGRDCLWGTCPALPTGTLQPLSCGADHRAKWGSDGYSVSGHWCAAACGPLGCTRP